MSFFTIPDSSIVLTDLTKRFGTKTAVSNVNLNINRGEVYGLIGPNGAGKSTTMRMLVDILRPTSGSIRILGKDPRKSGADLRQHIGYLPGEFITTPHQTGGQMLRHFTTLNPPQDPARLKDLQERLGADLTRPIGKLSKGNKQKIGLIQAFVHDPAVLILDEPTSGLDPIVQQTFLDLVREAANRGQTVFLSSHILSEIQHVAQRVGVMKDGQLIATSTVQQIRDDAGQRLRAVIALGTPWDAQASLIAAFEERMREHLPTSELTVHDQGETVLMTGVIRDPVEALMRYLGSIRVLEMTLEKPDLEESVLGLYRGSTQHPETKEVAQ